MATKPRPHSALLFDEAWDKSPGEVSPLQSAVRGLVDLGWRATARKGKRRVTVQRVEIGSYLVIDPEIGHGKMTFRGTRVPVDTVLTFLAKG